MVIYFLKNKKGILPPKGEMRILPPAPQRGEMRMVLQIPPLGGQGAEFISPF